MPRTLTIWCLCGQKCTVLNAFMLCPRCDWQEIEKIQAAIDADRAQSSSGMDAAFARAGTGPSPLPEWEDFIRHDGPFPESSIKNSSHLAQPDGYPGTVIPDISPVLGISS